MAFNDWRDITDQSAYTPNSEKFEQVQNLFAGFGYYYNRPLSPEIMLKLKETDYVSFIAYWLLDVLNDIFYEHQEAWTLYDALNGIDRNITEGVIDLTYDFTAGDIVFLNIDTDFSIQITDNYFIGVWFDEDTFLGFTPAGIFKDGLNDFLTQYPDYTNMSVFRI